MLSSFLGQSEAKQSLEILIKSSRNQTLPHILFTGGAGLGKSSLARSVAREMNYKFTEVNSAYTGSAQESRLKLMIALEDVKQNDIIFIDEVHGLSRSCQEMLYTAMEDFYINYGDIFGYKKQIPSFTLIGATTDLSGLTHSMQARFKHVVYLRKYKDGEIAEILKPLSSSVDVAALSTYCRGNPRQAKNYLDWVTRYCEVKRVAGDSKGIKEAMNSINIYSLGLTTDDLNYISLLKQKKILGVRTIAHTLNIEEKTVKVKIEPYLMELGLINILHNFGGKRSVNLAKCVELGL